MHPSIHQRRSAQPLSRASSVLGGASGHSDSGGGSSYFQSGPWLEAAVVVVLAATSRHVEPGPWLEAAV